MENKINVAELLKDCPKGMELYSPLCGTCVFDRLNMGTIICKKQNTQEITFTSEGYYMIPVFEDCECMIFPSKDQRDWSKFHRPFKDGEILSNGVCICIYNGNENNNYYGLYVGVGHIDFPNYFICVPQNGYFTKEYTRLATEEEKAKLFQAIKDNGYKWNAETKTLEKLPKFKVGDRIRHKSTKLYCTLGEYSEGISAYRTNIGLSITHKDLEDWELIPNKFDINTLVPFESRVLVRAADNQFWRPAIWGVKQEDWDFCCVLGGEMWEQCIPYEGNEHLLGKEGDCSEFYKTWK